jgi:hypothetical protein
MGYSRGTQWVLTVKHRLRAVWIGAFGRILREAESHRLQAPNMVLNGYSHGTGWYSHGYLDTCGPIVFASDRGVSVGLHLSRNHVKSERLCGSLRVVLG